MFLVFVYGSFTRLRQNCSFTGASIRCRAEGESADFWYISVMKYPYIPDTILVQIPFLQRLIQIKLLITGEKAQKIKVDSF